MKYSQIGQDKFVLSVLGETHRGTFVDIGCHLPFEISNTLLLEEKGWTGVAIDIVDFSREWEERSTPFVQGNALECDYAQIFDDYDLPMVIDYLSVDVESSGDRFNVLKEVLLANREFRLITVEHDLYKGYRETEQVPQRNLLSRLGYSLVASNVGSGNGLPMEDWWANTRLVNADNYASFLSSGMAYRDIFAKAGITI
ncbi:MAG: hypothetical protein HOC23_16720 [Halieaceae bacterium]|jgi:hypothetical protein|nr:hypothetical protein [Halieaceae bacterium]